jgi:magnesium-transporting ATPase (P-type)
MFDGAPAVRQLASIVLTNNSFSALPGGVALADSIIRNVEIFASIFINLSFTSFLLFIGVSLFGQEFPLTPLNITLINYFTVGIPGILISYWTIMSETSAEPLSKKPFLKKILPFAAFSAFIETAFILVVFILSPDYLKLEQSNILVIIASIISGFVFFMFTPYVYRRLITGIQKIQILVTALVESILLIIILKIPLITNFFDTTNIIPSFSLFSGIIIFVSFSLLILFQYLLARWFVLQKVS